MSGGGRVLGGDAGQVGGVDDHVDVGHRGHLAELAQLQGGERGLQRAAPPNDHHLLHPAAAQRVQRVVGDVGGGQLVAVRHQHPRHVERDVAVADHHRPRPGQVRRQVVEVRVGVVPADELDGGQAAGQVLAGNAERAVGLGADGVDHRVVALGQIGGADLIADGAVAEEAATRIGGELLELPADRLDLGVIRRHAGADQAPGRRQHLQHVDPELVFAGFLGGPQQGRRGEETGRAGADNRYVIGAHGLPFRPGGLHPGYRSARVGCSRRSSRL